jgi:hypothetical protein
MRVAVGGIAVAVLNQGESASAFREPWGWRKRVWVCLGMLEAGLRSFLNGVSLNCSEMTCPNPLLAICEIGKLPRFPTPLPGSPDSLCGAGEQIPQVNAILLLISGNVHRASLKQTELI